MSVYGDPIDLFASLSKEFDIKIRTTNGVAYDRGSTLMLFSVLIIFSYTSLSSEWMKNIENMALGIGQISSLLAER